MMNAAEKLVAIGCFCIGTNQVDSGCGGKRGIQVITHRSKYALCCELVIGELLLLLARRAGSHAKAHRGVWNKLAAGPLKRAAKSWVSSLRSYWYAIGHLADIVGNVCLLLRHRKQTAAGQRHSGTASF
ncbi:hypothetical protein ACNKHT_18710 [Shigella flexneri]